MPNICDYAFLKETSQCPFLTLRELYELRRDFFWEQSIDSKHRASGSVCMRLEPFFMEDAAR